MFKRSLLRQFPPRILPKLPPLHRCQPSPTQRMFMSTQGTPEAESNPTEPNPTEPNPTNQEPNPLSAELESLKKELEKKIEEAKDFKDKFTRTVADFRNLQDRTEREKKSARDFAIQKFAKDLVDSVDNLDRALTAVPESSRNDVEKNKDLVDLYNGLKLTESILLSTLKKHGLEKIDPVGETFDPNRHEAMFQVPDPDKPPNTVFHVQQTGFMLNGRTIRAAKVGVVATPE